MSRVMLLAGVLFLAGCGKGDAPEESNQDASDTGIKVRVDEWLGQSREQLAELEREWAEKVRLEELDLSRTRDDRQFLATLRVPILVPIWQEATWSALSRISLPPYVKPGAKDAALAWHLARHGDLESARQLSGPDDFEKLASFHRSLYDRNYPAEWSRLAARTLQWLQLRLIQGTPESGAEIASIHKQLQKLFSTKERGSPLAAALLPMGKRTLQAARLAWEQDGQTDLARQASEALSAWGETPSGDLVLNPGAPRPVLDRLWGSKSEGRWVVATNLARALDLSGLPVPRKGIEAVAALFDDAEQVREIVLTYRPKLSVTLPSPADVLHDLEERGLTGVKGKEAAGVRQATYTRRGQACQVLVCVTNSRIGALVRFRREGAPDKMAGLGRDFGGVHLDASFEQNRLRLAPDRLADILTVTQSQSLSLLRHPLGVHDLQEATLARSKDSPSTERLFLRSTPEGGAFHAVVGPLFSQFGLGTVEPVNDDQGGHLAFTWEDTKTRYVFRVPNSESKGYEFEASNRSSAARADASAFDLAQRANRFAAGKLWTFLPRGLDPVPVVLGMSRSEAEKRLPRATKEPFGLRHIFPSDPTARGSFLPRQVLVRFGPDGRVAELRLLLFETTAQSNPDLLARLREKYGKTAESPSRWAGLRPGEVATNGSRSRWLDDLTIMTFERSANGVEWVLLDRPQDQPDGVALALLAFCPRGVSGCQLGETREAIIGGWKGTVQRKEGDDPLVLVPRGGGEIEAIFVWFEQGKAARILARHVRSGDRPAQPAERVRALDAVWGRMLATVGCWMVREGDEAGVTGYGWLDERTALRLFWQGDQGTPRLFTEWRDAGSSVR
ncbi:MAG: hypothetical protein HYS12_11305 [Planctomycetes bacterium]|nr:hypothetical protein [Planctomycetota bacterium]